MPHTPPAHTSEPSTAPQSPRARTGLNPALLAALEPSAKSVGSVVDDGSVMVAQDDATDEGGLHMFLTHKQTSNGSAWTVLSGTRRGFVSTTVIAAADLAALYAMAVRQSAIARMSALSGIRSGARREAQWTQVQDLVRTLMLSHYDEADPIEAAEKVMVALGAAPRTTPRSVLAFVEAHS